MAPPLCEAARANTAARSAPSRAQALRTLYLNGCDGLAELPDVSALTLDANGFSPPEHLTPAEGVAFVRLAKIGGKTIS